MLQVKNLTKVYRPKKGPEVLALDKVNLDFQEKALVFLLGKSGSGKSTLLNLLGGLDSYTDGEVIIKGKSSKEFKGSDFDSYRNTFIGFVFQEFYILEEYSVEKNIAIALELQGKKADKATVDKILKEVDLEGYGDRKPNELSGGQKQRVAIARALIKEPEIILADEPTGSLDSNTGRQIFETLKKLSRDKLIIVVSHDRENAEKYADRIIELKDGRVSEDVSLTSAVNAEGKNVVFFKDTIYIKPGHELTSEDTEEINERLKKSGTGAYISLSEEKNKEFAAETPSDSGEQRYLPTKKDNLNLKSYKASDFKLVKSRFPYKDSLKMGASGLKYKRIRLAFTIILSFFAFTMFGIADTMAAFNEIDTNVSTIMDNGVKVVSVYHQMGTKFSGEYMYYNTDKVLTEAHIKWVEENFISKPYPVDNFYADFGDNLKDHPYNNYNNDVDYSKLRSYVTNIRGLIKLDTTSEGAFNTDLFNLSLELIAGSMPGSNQILISQGAADSFVYYNYAKRMEHGFNEMPPGNDFEYDYRPTPVEPAEINSYEDLIGKKVLSKQNIGPQDGSGEYEGFTISGIVKTDISPEKYSQIAQSPLASVEWGLESVIFVGSNSGFNLESNNSRVFVKLPGSRAEVMRLFNSALENATEAEEGFGVRERLWIGSNYTGTIETFNALATILKKVFLYSSIVFCAFSFLLFINFIGTSIANKRKEIGILRAIGARGTDVYGIFFNESMIIALINLTLSVAATILTASAFNKALGISMMVVGVRQIGFMTLLAAGVAALGSFIPVYRFVKKKPIETINNR